MTRHFNPAKGYKLFDELSRQINAWTSGNSPSVLGYGQRDIARRLSQRIADLGLNPFLRETSRRYEAGLEPLPGGRATLHCGGLRITTHDGRVVPGIGLFIRSTAGFLAHWWRVLFSFICAMFRRQKWPMLPVTVVLGIGQESLFSDGSDSRFFDFARRGPITPLREAACLAVQSLVQRPSIHPDKIVYCRHPLLELANARPVSAAAAVSFFIGHASAFFQFFKLSFQLPVACLLARDLAYHALATSLNRREIVDALVITNSLYLAQPLWMRALPDRKFSTHMVWYSQNSIPFVYKEDGVKAHIPNFSHIWVDHVWVWSDGFAEYLRQLGVHGDMHVVGPILWYLPENTPHESRKDVARIAVFDVTPMNPAFVRKIGLTYNYYREETVSKFISGILAVCDQLQISGSRPIELILKHKRQPGQTHEKGYLSRIQEFVASGRITLVPPHTNLYTLISGVDAVVVLPFSSPAHVGIQLGKPTVFFDPAGEIMPTHETETQIEFVAGGKALRDGREAELIAPASQARHNRG